MAARGLGKRSGFPDTQCIRGSKDKKETVAKAKREQQRKKGTADPCENYKGWSRTENSLVRISMRMHYRNWRILSNSLVCCSRFWYRIVRIIMRLLPVKMACSQVGGGLKEVPVIIRNYTEQEDCGDFLD